MPATIATGEVVVAPPLSVVAELGVFGAMALLAMIQAGADPGYRHVRRLQARGIRLAPHRALRHEIVASLIEAGVLVPAVPRRLKLDATLADPDWEDGNIDDADWVIYWDDTVRSSLPKRLKEFLDDFPRTTRNLEVLMDAWTALAKAECLAFAEYALTAHRMDPRIALAAENELGPVLARYSIGQACAFMWWAAKNVASSFLRHGGQPGLAEREMSRSISNAFGRSDAGTGAVPQFRRHHAIPVSTFANAFITASRLGDAYWTSPISDDALRDRFVDE